MNTDISTIRDEGTILYVDKPTGVTSFDVIRLLRKRYDVRKMGHAGTLDPLASGLLIIGVGKGTKELSRFLKLSKVYETTVLIGKRTTTGDLEGEILEDVRGAVSVPREAVERTLASLMGTIELSVPVYSAVKLQGKTLYARARRGEIVSPPVKTMEITHIELIDLVEADGYIYATIRMGVASGTYVRSVAEEIGRRLGYPATVSALRRTSIGDIDVSRAERLAIEDFEEILRRKGRIRT